MTATTHLGAPYRPDRRALLGLGRRAALVVLAAAAVALEAPAWLRLPLSAAAAAVVALAWAGRVRRRGVLDTALIAVGAAVTALVLLGLVLNALPVGLSAGGWALGVALLELAVLVTLTLRRPPASPPSRLRRPRPAAVAWAAAVVVVLGAAVAWSAASFTATHVAPLALEAQPRDGATRVTVTSGAEQGPFRLELVTADGRSVLARDLRVGPERTATATVDLPARTRALVQLVPEDGTGAVRELILDTSSGTGS